VARELDALIAQRAPLMRRSPTRYGPELTSRAVLAWSRGAGPGRRFRLPHFAHPSASSKLYRRLLSAKLLIWRRRSEWVPTGAGEQPERKPGAREGF
jgi:hypothetical protein